MMRPDDLARDYELTAVAGRPGARPPGPFLPLPFPPDADTCPSGTRFRFEIRAGVARFVGAERPEGG